MCYDSFIIGTYAAKPAKGNFNENLETLND